MVVAIRIGGYYRFHGWEPKRYAIAEEIKPTFHGMKVRLKLKCGIESWCVDGWYYAKDVIAC